MALHPFPEKTNKYLNFWVSIWFLTLISHQNFDYIVKEGWTNVKINHIFEIQSFLDRIARICSEENYIKEYLKAR